MTPGGGFMKHRMFVLGLVCLSSVFRPFLSEAQAPSLINYQGRLVSGTNLVNGNVGLSLRLFNVPSGGSSIYEDSNSVTVVDGLYATFLGDQTNSGNFVSALTNATVFVEVAVNGVALAPRERIASVAYALDANNAAAVGGLPAGALATGTPVYVESDPFWSAASNGMQSQITAETAARLGADAALTNLISDETAARLGTGAALSNSVASLATNVAARLDSNAWAAADSTTNYVRRTGDTMSGVLTNLAGFVGNGAGVTNVDLGSVTAISTRPNVIAWGYNFYGQTNVPESATGVVAVAAGGMHSLALRGDGTVIAWGYNVYGQTNVPESATGVVAIAGGFYHNLALRGDGTVIAWGYNDYGQTNVPATATGVVAVAAGAFHSLALRGDGTVIAWGYNFYGQTNVPATATGVVAIASGDSHSLALRGDGTVIAWGQNSSGQTNVPESATGVVAVAGGGLHSLALRGDGTVIAWGDNSSGQTNVPASATGVVAVGASSSHSLALRGDGTVIAWGQNSSGQTNVPATATGVVAIAGGGDHSLALRSARVPAQLARLDAAANTFAGTVTAASFSGNGAGLTGLAASSLAPSLATNLAYLNGANQTFSGPLNFSSVSNTFTGTFSGNGAGVTNVDLGSVTAIAARPNVIAWGDNSYGQTNVPVTAAGVVAIAGGGDHSLALRGDGTVIAWGYNVSGQTNVPATATGVVAVAGGGSHSLALRGNGTVIAWGRQLRRPDERARDGDRRGGHRGRRRAQPRAARQRHGHRVGIQLIWPDERARDGDRGGGHRGRRLSQPRAARQRHSHRVGRQHLWPDERAGDGDGRGGHRGRRLSQPRAARRRHGHRVGRRLQWPDERTRDGDGRGGRRGPATLTASHCAATARSSRGETTATARQMCLRVQRGWRPSRPAAITVSRCEARARRRRSRGWMPRRIRLPEP
jgi:alpha-tubulin suppressor-like RCC1 family protein